MFVPSRPLAKGRVYTVTVKHGLPLAGTGQVLADDVVVRFETAAKARSAVTVDLQRSFLEANRARRPRSASSSTCRKTRRPRPRFRSPSIV